MIKKYYKANNIPAQEKGSHKDWVAITKGPRFFRKQVSVADLQSFSGQWITFKKLISSKTIFYLNI